jgi:hypothetical protein
MQSPKLGGGCVGLPRPKSLFMVLEAGNETDHGRRQNLSLFYQLLCD